MCILLVVTLQSHAGLLHSVDQNCSTSVHIVLRDLPSVLRNSSSEKRNRIAFKDPRCFRKMYYLRHRRLQTRSFIFLGSEMKTRIILSDTNRSRLYIQMTRVQKKSVSRILSLADVVWSIKYVRTLFAGNNMHPQTRRYIHIDIIVPFARIDGLL